MKKRLFQILDEMNVADGDNKTANLGVCNVVTAVNYSAKKGGTEVTIGAPGNLVFDIEDGKTMPILLLINKAEYDRIHTTPSPDEAGEKEKI